ncbi:MAG: hypothetical protein IKJ47_05490, partial [Oscillospiraceae bacterium]|nr:hypothetical protein [Oscillospiraceae bacterium]
MIFLYDIISIIPLSFILLMLFGINLNIPQNVTGYIISVIFSLWIIILKNTGKKSRLINIGVVTVFIIGTALVSKPEQREF